LVIALPDDDLADLLGAVPEATTFISNALALETAAVAVHCHAGESRSSAIVAAYLLRFEHVNIDDALAAVEALGGAPNDGFRSQLELWAQMGCRVSTANEAYKLWSVAKIARERDERGYLESTSVMRDPGAPGAVEDPEGGGWVSCRKCRRRLARSTHVLRHDHGQGIDAFSWKQRRKESARAIDDVRRPCSSMFVAPLSWMKGIEDGDGGETRGKLTCPACATKIGAFDWAGIQCSCGAWVSPGFQIQRAKTDAFGI
jgi:dual specificity phosphatase 12|tara:strand:- start:2401 stop:3174 length:774 start_codon:yes stop_codon:yes gene_type:complete